MLKKTITYSDYDGVERTEDFYFNLTEAEIVEMQMSTDGGLDVVLQKIIAEKDVRRIFDHFKAIILKSYGEKTLDGRRFVKSKEISEAFSQTEAYNTLFMELLGDTDQVVKFVNAIMPAKLAARLTQN